MARFGGNGGEMKHDVQEQIQEVYGEVREKVEEASGRLAELVRDRPMTSILAGVGIGFLIGKLLSR
jgi:ElaB/YqjD/DUF883 family membrane-anchored ribosome-binding protein